MTNLKIIKAKRAGFCFGVKRAVELAFKSAKKSKGVYTLGPLIHNPQVIEKLSSEGVHPTENIDDKNINTLIIRTHGIPLQLHEMLKKKSFTIIDATCPFVKKAQQYAKLLSSEGYQVIIFGDEKHPEVIGLISYSGDDTIVLNSNSNIIKLKKKRVGVIVQTTQPANLFREFISKLVKDVKELKVFNTICNSTALRLNETKNIAQKVDLMIVAGGKNSANTTQLATFCRLSVPTYHVETAEEIQNDWFKQVSTVGITAGASTPEWIINEIEERIRYIGGNGDNGYPR
ncbi:MAG: 4-hydroxy-3-methylbut-2-enyl diphosphate reductase [Thermodesulfovibrionales bacterium]|nr:4-hydroxy-3-methylbut-2-enyl diphosphate reductase [Thermodesulfovibrionales bacterium]